MIVTPSQSPLQFFAAVYLINLPERVDRLRETQDDLARMDLAGAQRVVISPGVRATTAYKFPSAGAYGCFQAHLGALRSARDRGAANVLILEDDVRFDADAPAAWPAIEAELQQREWSVLNLGFEQTERVRRNSKHSLVVVREPLMLAHCYAVNGPSLGPLIEYLETLATRAPGDPRGGPMHFDGALHHYCMEHPEPPRLRTAVRLAGQRSSRSDIAATRWLDRPPFRGITTLLRRWKNRSER